MTKREIIDCTRQIIGAAIDVHRELGPGLLESAYEQCLIIELRRRGLRVQTQVSIPLTYKGQKVESSYRIDIIVEDSVVVEVKAVEALAKVHEAQTLTYMRISQCPLGLLINFNVPQLIQGLRRFIIDVEEKSGRLSTPAQSAL